MYANRRLQQCSLPWLLFISNDSSQRHLMVGGDRLMKAKLLLIAGILMAPICVLGLWWQWGSIWVLCPQALIVMFIRQWQSAYDSLGAADYPDLAVGALYYPLVGWLLSGAVKRGSFARVSASVGLWHVVAMGVAWAACELRNRLWWMG
jgi:hypothetical protein